MKEPCVGRRVGGEVPAKSRGVSEGRAVGDKAGGRWCLVRGASEPGLSPADTPGGSSFLRLHQVCRENKMGGGQEGEGRQWEWEAAMARGLGRVRVQRAHLLSPA